MEERRSSPALTGLQLAILQILWDRGEATVADVLGALQPSRKLAQSTVATVLSRLERRGVVAYRTVGRQYVYRAVVSAEQARESALAEVADGLFAGDVAALVSELLSSREVGPGDLERVRALIESKERQLEGKKR